MCYIMCTTVHCPAQLPYYGTLSGATFCITDHCPEARFLHIFCPRILLLRRLTWTPRYRVFFFSLINSHSLPLPAQSLSAGEFIRNFFSSLPLPAGSGREEKKKDTQSVRAGEHMSRVLWRGSLAIKKH